MENENDFGAYIRARRQQLDLSQNDVAKKLKVAQNYVTYLERNQRRPNDELIKKIAEVLSLPVDKLYLSAHPELKEFIELDEKKKHVQKLSPMLEELKNDKELIKRFKITPQEITELASIRLRGEVKSKEDYLFLLSSIRQVMK